MVPAAAAEPATSRPTLDQALDAISAFAPEALKQQGAPGMAVAITDATHTLRIITVGYSDLESKTPVTDETRFGIGSITKSFTAGALMQLRDAGKFDPHRPVTAYLPWFSIHSQYRALTPHDLLTHSSGLPDGGLSTGDYGPYELRDWYTGFAPGTHWSYSNVGYDTLGAILEKLDGTSDYAAIVRKRIFLPLQMTDTTAIWSPETLADAARGYEYVDDDTPNPPNEPLMRAPQTHYVDPAGSILTTPADMAKYMRYILNQGQGPSGRLISEGSWKLMTTPGVTDGHTLGAGGRGMFAGYGYGLGVHTVDGDTVVGHTGGVLQYTACMQIDLTRNYAAIAMSNLDYMGPRPCAIVNYAISVLQAYAEGKPLPPAPAAPDRRHVETAEQYAGHYAGHDGAPSLAVVTDGDNRLALRDGSQLIPLYPAGPDNFVVGSQTWSRYLLQFGRDENKRVVEAFWGPQWFTSSAYTGPTHFKYPAEWNAYIGHYETVNSNGYFDVMRVIVRKGMLTLDDGTPLTQVGNHLFRIGSDWSPSRALFDVMLDGKAQVVRQPGVTLYRATTP